MSMPSEMIIYLSGPPYERSEGQEMRFRLIYTGPLYARQNDNNSNQAYKKASHVHEIRKIFHQQLKRFWGENKFLAEHRVWRSVFTHPDALAHKAPTGVAAFGGEPDQLEPLVDVVADMYRENNYKFVPLVIKDWDLACEIDVLFLRYDPPGSLVHAGDLDNRLKTLIDALRKPDHANQLKGNEFPADGEDPFFVLLEDDKLLTGLSVTTDVLLDPGPDPKPNPHHVHLVITATIRPMNATVFNLSFA